MALLMNLAALHTQNPSLGNLRDLVASKLHNVRTRIPVASSKQGVVVVKTTMKILGHGLTVRAVSDPMSHTAMNTLICHEKLTI